MAADFARGGHEVRLFTRSRDKLSDLQDRGGVKITGSLGEDFVRLAKCTGDIEEAVRGADLIVLVVPGMVQDSYLRAVLPHIDPGQALWLSPGSGGSLIARQLLFGRKAQDVLLIETMTLPYAVRRVAPAAVAITARFKPRLAAFPAKRTPEAKAVLAEFYDDLPVAENVLDTALNNVNFMIHPLPALLNMGWIEARDRRFSLYGEGMTPLVLSAIAALDEERLKILDGLGLQQIPLDALYDELGAGPLYRQPMGLGDAERFEDRFITEDVPVGHVAMASLGRQIGIKTPLIDGIIALSSALYQTDFWANGRTAKVLGLNGMTVEEMRQYVEEG